MVKDKEIIKKRFGWLKIIVEFSIQICLEANIENYWE